ncbi:SDR family NAD(P)-dependent oxidoreductase [Microbacterium sp. X-17]|uniref:SDR family NAD(P)-dependent oxidoreductase n=1 Tax=Microbacterium sp. X-17 TaxID=3144404 RepID=UPI0031F57977
MPTIAVVGAGPGLGIEIARGFGRRGFRVALIARNQERLDALVATLRNEGIEAAGFEADVTDADAVAEAFDRIRATYGRVDVLEFSPAARDLASAVEAPDVSLANIRPHVDFYVGGAINSVSQVLPDMITAGAGTILITTGGGSVEPLPYLANVNIAAAGLRNWVLNLHNVLSSKGVYVAHVAIMAWIGGGRPDAEPSVIAQQYLDLFDERTRAELHYVAIDG